MPRQHQRLEVWRESIRLVKQVYRVTDGFPREEVYGLTSQMRRAAVSVPSNIAEGAARGSQKEFLQFLTVARGSLAELETQLIVAQELSMLGEADFKQTMSSLEKTFALLSGLMTSLRTKPGRRQ